MPIIRTIAATLGSGRPGVLRLGILALAAMLGLGTGAPGTGSAAEAARFHGVEITVGVMEGMSIAGPAKAHARTWAVRTGGKVKVVEIPFDRLFDTFKAALTTGRPDFDVIIYGPNWAGDFFSHLAEVPARLVETEDFDDVYPIYRDRLTRWDDRWIAMTLDGDLFMGYYRKDLFEDPRHRAEFKARFGYDLMPPDTWAQYRDIAEFFNGRPGPDGRALAGAVESFAPGTLWVWTVFSRAAAYTNRPGDPGVQFFDPDTMKAQINNPGWVRATQDFFDILRFCPPEARRFGAPQVRDFFIRGGAALALDWGDIGQIAANAPESAVTGKVGYYVLPGSREVWNRRTGQWEPLPSAHKVPFLAFGGWVAGVPKNSRHQDAAWDYIAWYGSPENSLHDVVTSGTGINPYRYSHFLNIDAWTRAFTKQGASEYLGVISASLDSPHVGLDLRIPGFSSYASALEEGLSHILGEGAPVAAALDEVAAAWEKITDSLGRPQQLAIYRASMGLPPK